ncbi:MAG: pilus assembly PilX family protein, partial [Gammaproteobacteria bacterium]
SIAPRAAVRGMALIVALVLLLVMTMIAVVAMRSTTLDLKMTTNTALNRRAFQAAESVRAIVGPLLEAHAFWDGWPVALGGEFADALFPEGLDPTHLVIVDVGSYPVRQPYTLAELDVGDVRRDPDIEYREDLDTDGVIDNEDMAVDVWITKLGIGKAENMALESGGSINSLPVIFNVQTEGRSAGNASVRTDAEFRVRIKVGS